MPDFLRATRNKRNALAEAGYHLFDLVSYEFLYLLSPSRRDLFFNGGYLPLASDFLADAVPAAEAHCAMMYHFVAKTHPRPRDIAPRRILDVGCGQGGGVFYLSKLFPEATVVGTDRSRAAVYRAKRTVSDVGNTEIHLTDRNGSGFIEGPFDLIVGIGTPTYVGLANFVERGHAVLTPGGMISISGGYRQGDHKKNREDLEATAERAGMVLESYQNIVPNTFAALQADIPRREAAVERTPWPFRNYGRRWADLPGSVEYEEYRTGKRVDFAAVLRRA